MNEPRSEIQSFYKDKIIFITGASGFIGKVLMEKLLYSCSDLSKIYILLRGKRNRSSEDRLQNIFNMPLFQRLLTEKPQSLRKVIPLSGDVLTDNLGLTIEDCERLINEVNVIFHCAASLNMRAKLKESVEINMKGTLRVLELAKQMKHLRAFLYLSTAYCHVDQDVLEEHIYNSPHDPHEVMRLVQWLDEETIDLITPKLLGPHPNCYTYTKNLTESLVAKEYPNLPCCIARPSIILPAFSEPLPGWVDNFNGPTGLIIGAGKGIIRSIYCRSDYNAEILPVDIAINYLILIAYSVATSEKKLDNIPVFNVTQGNMRPITWGEMFELNRDFFYENPFEGQIWYPANNFIHNSKFLHYLFVFFFHIIPAYLIDFLLLIFRRKRFMVRYQKTISASLEVLQYFLTRNWKFSVDKMYALIDELSPADQKIFPNFRDIDETKYVKDVVLGMRQYCMKENLSTLPKARRRQKVLYIVHITILYLFYFGIFYFIYNNCEEMKSLVNYVIDKIYPSRMI